MRIAYTNHGRFPTEKAHGFQIAQVCDALTELGHEVALLKPTLLNPVTEDPRSFYGLRYPLKVETVKSLDAFQKKSVPGALAFLVSMLSYSKALKKHLRPERYDCLYLRSPLLLKAALQSSIPVIMELHALPRFNRRRFAKRCNQCRLVVCLTQAMADELLSWGVEHDHVCIEADGVDLHRFENLPDALDAKSDGNLPADHPIVGYVGSLTTQETLEKGVRELIDAASILATESSNSPVQLRPMIWIVGGPDSWVKIYQDYAISLGLTEDDIRFEGRIDPSKVPWAIAACDVCVYPAPESDHSYFMRDTSPLKLFEYLAAGRPVVCADIPPVRDVVSESSVKFFRPGDAQDLAEAVHEVLSHPDQASNRLEEGKRIAAEHSWEKRMERILKTFSATV